MERLFEYLMIYSIRIALLALYHYVLVGDTCSKGMVRRCTVISGCIKLVVVFVFACVFVCRVDMCVYCHEMHSLVVECPNHVCVDFG